MLLAVEQGDGTSTTGKPPATLGHGLLDALLHRRDVALRDGAADDLVVELEAAAPLERLDPQHAHGELAVAAGLLLVAALGLGGAGDRLLVGDPQRLGVDVHAEAALQPLDGDGELDLAEPAQQQLAGAGPLDDAGSGPPRTGGRGRGRACRRRPACGARAPRRRPPGAARARRCAPACPWARARRRCGCRRAWRRRRGRRRRPRDVEVLLAPQREEGVEPLVAAGAGVGEVVVGRDRARQHPEQRQVADVRVGDRVEHDGERVAGGIDGDLDLACRRRGRWRDGRRAAGRSRRCSRRGGRCRRR